MLQVHDQIMLDMFLRSLLLLGFLGYIATLQVHDQMMPKLWTYAAGTLNLCSWNSELWTRNSELWTLNSKLRTLNSTHALG
jgi:hypothetical protein